MKHINEDELILHYYGEPKSAPERQHEVEQHLTECAQCRLEFGELKAALAAVPVLAVPRLAEDYEQQVWAKLQPQLRERRATWWSWMLAPQRLVAAGAALAIVLLAFGAGRWYEQRNPVSPLANDVKPNKERVILVAVGGHLERSQLLLVEMLTAPDQKGKVDISLQQEMARDLLDSNRVLRVSAAQTNDPAMQKTLDDLERILVEISNSPSELDSASVEQLQRSIESQDLLFRVRVIGNKLRNNRSADQQSKTQTQRM